MKKFFAITLAVVMMMATALPALAEGNAGSNPSYINKSSGDYSIVVTGKYVASGTAGEKISVDIAWESMDFTYTAGDSSYDVTTHKTTTTNGSWSTNKPDITVTNHSNVAMSAGFSFTATADGVKGVLTNESVILESANMEKYQTNTGTEEDPVYAAPNASTSFSIDPTSSAISATGLLGTITVKLAKYDGFVYDATEATDQATVQAALTAAIQAGETKLTVLGNNSYIVPAVKSAISASSSSIDLTLCDVTKIDNEAFSGCSNLKSITLPKVTTIGMNAFIGCQNLQSVNAPSVTTLDYGAFYICTALTSVSLPEVTTVGAFAFWNCTALTTVSLPKCTNLDGYAFSDCTSLKGITFGTPVTKWSTEVFHNITTSNVTLTVAGGQKTFTQNGSTWNIDNSKELTAEDTTFCGYTFKEIIISSNTTENN